MGICPKGLCFLMGLFLSTFVNKIDKKGRVSVPASFRGALSGQIFQGFVAFRSLKLEAIEGFGMDRIERLSKSFDEMDLFSQEHEDWSASIFADAQQLAFDSEGRVSLTQAMIDHAHLKDQVAFVGRGATFQIWDPQRFQGQQEEARKRLRARKVSGVLAGESGSKIPLEH
jgi:MraZ protein